MDQVEAVHVKERAPAEAEEEAPKAPEITQTDHLNKAMLSSFKALLDSNQFKFPAPPQGAKADDDNSADFADDGKYEDEDYLSQDPEKAEEERRKAVEFFRSILHAPTPSSAQPTKP